MPCSKRKSSIKQSNMTHGRVSFSFLSSPFLLPHFFSPFLLGCEGTLFLDMAFVRVRRYRLHFTKHYIISLSDNRSQSDDRVWFHSDKCREKSASVSTCCNIYRSHASVEKLGSLHDSVTSPVGSVQDTVSSCGLHPRCVPWTGHVPWILYEDSDDYCSI